MDGRQKFSANLTIPLRAHFLYTLEMQSHTKKWFNTGILWPEKYSEKLSSLSSEHSVDDRPKQPDTIF